MTEHIKYLEKRVSGVISALSKVLVNTLGPRHKKRRVMCSAALSIMLYGHQQWSPALKWKVYKNRIERLNRRLALRIICGYRTVSLEASLALAKLPPMELQVKYRTKRSGATLGELKQFDKEMLEEWNMRWSSYVGWASYFITNISDWYTCSWTWVDYHTTMAFTGHGIFGTYLFKIGKTEDENCWFCGERDSPEHALFECKNFSDNRTEIERELGCVITKHTVAGLLIKDEETWIVLSGYFKDIMITRQNEERRRASA